MSISLLFRELYKPVLYTIKSLGGIFAKMEVWWISKTDYTKLNIRWIMFVSLLFAFAVLREVKQRENELVNTTRSHDDNVLLQKKVSFLEYRYLSKLEEDIKELKNIRKIAIHNEEQLKEIKK